ncbi:GyrI-like domain-containing protein [Legionella sp. CNM-1927-20]|uniref:GyrI-like domain-containing protein n=1 Tax=Legionella sp. CNM-1927-20 TaxID=3422221 RepID=UPI00403AFBF8
MTIIKPNVQLVDSFTVMGFSTRTKNSDEAMKNTAKIPKLWQKFYASKLKDTVPTFGVYSDYESNTDGLYSITVGVTTDNRQLKLSCATVIAGRYLVFKNKGPMPSTIIDTWKQIWEYFDYHQPKLQRKFTTDFECYNGSEVAVYIGVK